jgi:UDP-N-acetylglucosamine acyltransferase
MGVSIDPTARVSPKADLGDGVSIGPFSVVEENVVIGDETQVHSSVLVASGARIGKGCQIHHGTVVSTLPQDLKFAGEETTLEIHDGTVVREFVTLNRGTKDRWKTSIGSNCLLMAYVHISHDSDIGNNVILANAVNMGGHVTIEDYAMIGGLVGIHQFVHIGSHVMVGAHFRVMKDVPPYILVGREPLSFEGLNIVGLKRRKFSPEAIKSIETAYRYIYESNLNVSQAVEKIKKEMVITDEVKHIIEFIKGSKRGIVGVKPK